MTRGCTALHPALSRPLARVVRLIVRRVARLLPGRLVATTHPLPAAARPCGLSVAVAVANAAPQSLRRRHAALVARPFRRGGRLPHLALVGRPTAGKRGCWKGGRTLGGAICRRAELAHAAVVSGLWAARVLEAARGLAIWATPVPLGNAGEWWRETLHVKAAVAFVAEQHAVVVLPAAAQLARDVGHAHHDRLHYILCAASWWCHGSRASGSSRC